jgi:seryl-tRNA synthetase
MKTVFLALLCTLAVALPVAAQDRIYRCGNEYTNTATEEQMKNCKLVTGGNVTIVQSTKPAGKASGSSRAAPDPTAARQDGAAQRERDNDTRAILESELKKTQDRLAELQREYNSGEPEKRGDEARNYQKYLDRVAELKSSIARAENDISGIKRELGRVPGNR